MVEDLFLPIQIVRCQTIREKSGLAMSSRNRYLDEKARAGAAFIFETLSQAKNIATAKKSLTERGFKIQYLEAWTSDLERPAKNTAPSRWLIAAIFEGVRLIDNFLKK